LVQIPSRKPGRAHGLQILKHMVIEPRAPRRIVQIGPQIDLKGSLDRRGVIGDAQIVQQIGDQPPGAFAGETLDMARVQRRPAIGGKAHAQRRSMSGALSISVPSRSKMIAERAGIGAISCG
jgi:hypothetical protein